MVNAIDSMKNEANQRDLTIKSEMADAQLVVSVSDVGVGLRPDTVERRGSVRRVRARAAEPLDSQGASASA